jgi:hypothetical protein
VAKKSMTIEQVKKAKVQLELDILKLMKSFETDTGVRTGYINIQRKSDHFYEEAVPVETKKGKKKDRTLKNIEVSMDIDVI